MATLCKNCGGPLIFKPEINRMFCNSCGTSFDVRDIDITDRELLEEMKALPAKEIYGFDDKDFMDVNIYTCNQCGAEVIVNNTEVSTYCMYCGNPTVVFSRVAKQKRPEFILPFSVSKEQAVANIRSSMNRGFFVPDELKKFKPEMVRGIYIPYWIVNCEHHNTVFLKGDVRDGKNTSTKYFERAGECTLKNLPLDASRMLNDNTSEKLEPFDFAGLKTFDENYLQGFYSDMADVSEGELRSAANRRADQMFRDQVLYELLAENKSVIDSAPYTKVDPDKVYVMLPAWFITLNYQGEPLTILVNGDTGKVVCTLPFNKKKFITLTVLEAVALGIVFSIITFVIISMITFTFSGHYHSGTVRTNGRFIQLLVPAFAGIAAAFKGAVSRIKRFRENLHLTKSAQTHRYVKRRQG